MIKENRKKYILLFFLILSFLITLNKVSAATLNFSPNPINSNIGDIVKAEVVVSSEESINAVSGNVFFPNDVLSLVSISKNSSIINLWTQEPSFSNDNGSIKFEGVVFSGYSGQNGNIVTLFFKIRSKGNAVLKFSDISILANDGNGTNIYSGTAINGLINIGEKINISKKASIISCISKNDKIERSNEIGNPLIKESIICTAIKATEKIKEIEIANDLISNSLLTAVIIIFVMIISLIIICFFVLIFKLKRYFKRNLMRIESLVYKNFKRLDKNIDKLEKVDQKITENDRINIGTEEVKERIIKEIEEIKKES